FPTDEDLFGSYTADQQVQMLNWAKSKLAKYGFQISSFRPGSYSINSAYYAALKEAGFLYSSILDRSEQNININLLTNEVKARNPQDINGVTEFPVTSVKLKSIKGNPDIVNLSPDFFTIESMQRYFEELDYVNVNFHSFSVFTNKFLRENHENVWLHNFRY